jgi:hypothetical protein
VSVSGTQETGDSDKDPVLEACTWDEEGRWFPAVCSGNTVLSAAEEGTSFDAMSCEGGTHTSTLSKMSTWIATSTEVGLKGCERSQPLVGVCVPSLHTLFLVIKFLRRCMPVFFVTEQCPAEISSRASQIRSLQFVTDLLWPWHSIYRCYAVLKPILWRNWFPVQFASVSTVDLALWLISCLIKLCTKFKYFSYNISSESLGLWTLSIVQNSN